MIFSVEVEDRDEWGEKKEMELKK